MTDRKLGIEMAKKKKKNRWECKYYIDVFFFFFSFKLDLFFAFVHGHGAQFLLSQMRFTYDVFNGVVYIVNPISVCLTLNRKQLLKSFPRKVEIVLFDSQRILKTKNPSFYMPFVLTKISNFLPLIPPLRSPFPPNVKDIHARTKHDKLTQFSP